MVKDPESFRYAGSKVFTKAQYRMEVIARTEVLRAHNQGRLKFHDQVGVRKLEWMTMEDERVCPVCGPLDGKVFDTNRFPQQPAHPNCRCTSVVAWPPGDLRRRAWGPKPRTEPAACIIPPQTIEEQAKAKAAGRREAQGSLRRRTDRRPEHSEREATPDPGQAERRLHRPDQDRLHPSCSTRRSRAWTTPGLAGAALDAKLKEHKIGLLRTKDEPDPTPRRRNRRPSSRRSRLADQLKKIPPSGGLHDLTVVELQEMAKAKGVSLNMTKQDVIDLLDELEPGVDHTALQGRDPDRRQEEAPHRPAQEQAAACQGAGKGGR
ncbi:MAG: minor capsid protein [Desulfobacterales bacterium]|nr:minor capsid protein [Desulfobacterales bacterium]